MVAFIFLVLSLAQAETCRSVDGGTVCWLEKAIPPSSGSPYREFTPDEMASMATCWVQIEAKATDQHEVCLAKGSEAKCNSTACRWLNNKGECWATGYYDCLYKLKPKCELFRISKAEPKTSSDKKFFCDPARLEKMITRIK